MLHQQYGQATLDRIVETAVANDSLAKRRPRSRSPRRTRPFDLTERTSVPPSRLTPRQREVAVLVAAGMSNAAIAEHLVLTKGTVANHLASILDRLQLASRTDIAVWAVVHGLHAGPDPVLGSLEQLLNERPTSTREAMTRVANVITDVVRADKVDVFLLDPQRSTLVAVGTSTTALGRRERAAGLDSLPLANAGRVARVFEDGQPYFGPDVRSDPEELTGIRGELGVRSQIIVPLNIGDARRGVITAQSLRADFFVARDLQYLRIASHWAGLILQQLEPPTREPRAWTEADCRAAAEERVCAVAHGLRSNLAPLRGRLDLLRCRVERQGQAVSASDLAELQHAVARLEHLVEDLLPHMDVAKPRGTA